MNFIFIWRKQFNNWLAFFCPSDLSQIKTSLYDVNGDNAKFVGAHNDVNTDTDDVNPDMDDVNTDMDDVDDHLKGDEADNIFLVPRAAKTFLRVRRWNIKSLWGEEQEEESESRENGREHARRVEHARYVLYTCDYNPRVDTERSHICL